MAPPIYNLLQGAGIELLYAFVIIVCSLMIYYSTKEMYELSAYKGIKYFRYAFLFFAIAYFFKTFIKVLLVYFGQSRIIDINPMFVGAITLFIFIYFSAISVFYLVYSLMWKKWNGKPGILVVIYALSIIIALITITTKQVFILLSVISFVLLVAVLGILIAYNKSNSRHKKSSLYAIYILLFVFWILNIIEVLMPNFLQFYQILIYLVSTGLFLSILYKVLKKSGPN